MSESPAGIIQEIEAPKPISLAELPRQSYKTLPERGVISDKGVMTTLRLMKNRAAPKEPGKPSPEQFALISNYNGVATVENLMTGLEEHSAAAVEILAFNGLTTDPIDQTLKKDVLESHKKGQENYKKIVIYGDDFSSEEIHDLPPHVRVKKGKPLGFVHTHPRTKSVHSPTDFAHVAYQGSNMNGENISNISVVVTPDEFYMIVVPKDGKVEHVGTSAIGNPYSGIYGGLMEDDFNRRHPHGTPSDPPLFEFIKQRAQERQFGFYQGSLETGEITKIK